MHPDRTEELMQMARTRCAGMHDRVIGAELIEGTVHGKLPLGTLGSGTNAVWRGERLDRSRRLGRTRPTAGQHHRQDCGTRRTGAA